MKSIIVGGGKIGYYLLKTLKERNFDVVVIENDKRVCQSIAEDIGVEVICGDGTDIDVLIDAGINDAEVVAAVTGADEDNLVVCQIAKSIFHITKTIARVNNPKNIAMFKKLGVDKTVCSTAVIANLIEGEFDKDNFRIVQTFERGNMILVEIKIDKGSLWDDSFIKDLILPKDCVVTSILRNDKAIYPRGNSRIVNDDNILILTSSNGLNDLRKQFRGTKEK
ncbi:Trk system potassium uptake protein TrkA [bioreactor metagenome]|uniref:Trk system potassium uptake protein TrkA n=1 Tax=bioreactor metagenome TaxID=1076179 RepID=A0A645ALL5_9ZZZZ|nr:NAD-binding protein [Erysipelotrichaceae bacterium]